MKKTLLCVGLSLPFLFTSITSAQKLNRGFIHSRSLVISTAHKISGQTEKGAIVRVLQDKHTIATGKANYAGKFDIHINKLSRAV